MKTNIIIIAAAALLFLTAPSACRAGAPKTGGSYRIVADAVDKAGSANLNGGAYTMYQAVGQQGGAQSASGGSYSLIGGFLGVADKVAPTVSITAPAAGSSQGGAVDVVGGVFDRNGVRWTLYYGPGESPVMWKKIATGEGNMSADSFGKWDSSKLAGVYTLRVVGVDPRGNTATGTVTINVGNTTSFSSIVQPGKWVMVSLPGIPLDSNPASFLGNTRYEVQRWDQTMDPIPNTNDLRYRRVFPVTAGDAFWIKPYIDTISYTIAAWVPDTTKDFEKHLNAGWNQVGAPFNHDIAWSLFRFQPDNGTEKAMGAAISGGLIGNTYYGYAGNAYQANDIASTMTPFAGYFVYAFEPGTLRVNPGAGMPGGVARIIRPVYDWRLQVVADAGDARDAENYAGEMRGAADALDAEDSVEPPTVEPYVSVYFPHEEWGRGTGRFAADIRATQDENGVADKTWPFVVKTGEPNKAVTLSFPNAAKLPANYSIRARDESTGREIDPKAEGGYSFVTGADGTARFTILARKTGAKTGETSLRTTFPKGWALFSVPLETSDTDVRRQLGAGLAKLNVYQYADRRLYEPESAGRVDIQAGVGYWVYADAPYEAEFHGTPVGEGAAIDVPLAEGWNLIGNPFQAEMIFGDNNSVAYGGETLPLSEAAARGWIENRLFRYDGNGGIYRELAQGSPMTPWEGYIIKALKPCELRFKR